MLLQDMIIDYELLAKAVRFYTERGYRQVEVPWVVSEDASLSTAPNRERGCAFCLDDGNYLVASAEQGFVDRIAKIPQTNGEKLFSISPCFRNEPLDMTHSKWFMKLELYVSVFDLPGANFDYYIAWLASDATRFFLENGVQTAMAPTDIGYDLVDRHGLELGSYGRRDVMIRYDDSDHAYPFSFVYGTGLALPRFSFAQENQ